MQRRVIDKNTILQLISQYHGNTISSGQLQLYLNLYGFNLEIEERNEENEKPEEN